MTLDRLQISRSSGRGGLILSGLTVCLELDRVMSTSGIGTKRMDATSENRASLLHLNSSVRDHLSPSRDILGDEGAEFFRGCCPSAQYPVRPALPAMPDRRVP